MLIHLGNTSALSFKEQGKQLSFPLWRDTGRIKKIVTFLAMLYNKLSLMHLFYGGAACFVHQFQGELFISMTHSLKIIIYVNFVLPFVLKESHAPSPRLTFPL
jgi:hypothetical protein